MKNEKNKNELLIQYFDNLTEEERRTMRILNEIWEGTVPQVEWVAIDSDDYKFECGRYMLRVERMSRGQWWWCIYYDGNNITEESPNVPTEGEAKRRAEESFVSHWNS